MTAALAWLAANWKLLAVIGLLLGSYEFGYRSGTRDCRLAAAQQEATRARASEQAARTEKGKQDEAQNTADAVRSQPIVRVRCEAVPVRQPDVREAGGGELGRDLRDPGADRDDAPGLRELAAAALANNELAGVPSPYAEKP